MFAVLGLGDLEAVTLAGFTGGKIDARGTGRVLLQRGDAIAGAGLGFVILGPDDDFGIIEELDAELTAIGGYDLERMRNKSFSLTA
jgi:hypothetical protein